MFKSSRLLAKVAVAVLVSASLAAQARERNVILVIGDGMDGQQITIARNYLVGARGRLTLDTMPIRGVSQVLTVSEAGQAVYAMATGQVTSRGRIATTPGTDQAIETISQMVTGPVTKRGLFPPPV